MKKCADMDERGGLWVMTDLFVESLNYLAVTWRSSEQAEKRRKNRYCVPLFPSPLFPKDEFGGRFVRVRGHAKVMCHLMFGILALTADQFIRN